jgi:hypothetical protein
MNLLFSEEATNCKARSIALASALKIELADDIRAEQTRCPKTAADATLSPRVVKLKTLLFLKLLKFIKILLLLVSM